MIAGIQNIALGTPGSSGKTDQVADHAIPANAFLQLFSLNEADGAVSEPILPPAEKCATFIGEANLTGEKTLEDVESDQTAATAPAACGLWHPMLHVRAQLPQSRLSVTLGDCKSNSPELSPLPSAPDDHTFTAFDGLAPPDNAIKTPEPGTETVASEAGLAPVNDPARVPPAPQLNSVAPQTIQVAEQPVDLPPSIGAAPPIAGETIKGSTRGSGGSARKTEKEVRSETFPNLLVQAKEFTPSIAPIEAPDALHNLHSTQTAKPILQVQQCSDIVLLTLAQPAPSPSTGAQISIVESAMRQKWQGDEPNPTGMTDREGRAMMTAIPTINEVALVQAQHSLAKQSQTLVSLIVEEEQKTPAANDAVNAAKYDPAKIPVLTETSTNLSPKPTNIFKTESQADAGVQAKNTELDPTDFGMIAVAHRPHTTPLAVISHSTPAQAVFAKVSPTVVEMTKTGKNGPLDIALAPEELGRLTISIKQDGTSVHVTLTADRPETLDLMRRHGNDLVVDLRQSGFNSASLSFGMGGQSQQHRRFENLPDFRENSADANHTSDHHTVTPRRIQNGSGLDIRF